MAKEAHVDGALTDRPYIDLVACMLDMPSGDGNTRKLATYGVRTVQGIPTHEQRTPFRTSALATPGGAARYLRAHDVDAAELLCDGPSPSLAHGYPIICEAGEPPFRAAPGGVFRSPPEISPETSPAESRAPALRVCAIGASAPLSGSHRRQPGPNGPSYRRP